MAWTTPKTWTVDEVVGASDMNTHMRDNLVALKAPPHFETAFASGVLALSTTATEFTAITGSLQAALTTYGGDVQFYMAGLYSRDAADRRVSFDVQVDSTGRYHASATEGWGRFTIEVSTATSGVTKIFGPVWITGLASGAHTFRPVWKTNAGTAFLHATTAAAPIIMWVREVS